MPTSDEVSSSALPSKVDVARQELLRQIDRATRHLQRRAKAIVGDLARGEEAVAEADAARAFIAEAAKAPRGTKELVVTDWSSGEPVRRTLALQLDKRPLDQVEAIFAKARRLKRGAVIAQRRLSEATEKQVLLARLRAAATGATTLDELAAATAGARAEDPALLPGAPTTKTGRAPSQSRRLPYRTFVAPSSARVLVGRGASDNDELTLHVARPRDLWLHAKGYAGAHVVVPLKKGQDVPADVLVDAAHLAAHFSDARGETVVDITYVPRRYVRKPRGSPAGLVVVDREKCLVLRVDAARLALLLAREEER